MLMAEHGKVMGNSYVDMLVEMEMEDVKAKLDELKRLSKGTDQKTLAVLSLIWMVERRKEERWEEQREREEAEHREAHKKEEREEAGQGQGDKQELKGKREELAVLMDPRFKKAADRARLGDFWRRRHCMKERGEMWRKKGERRKFGRKLRTGGGWKGKEMK